MYFLCIMHDAVRRMKSYFKSFQGFFSLEDKEVTTVINLNRLLSMLLCLHPALTSLKTELISIQLYIQCIKKYAHYIQ